MTRTAAQLEELKQFVKNNKFYQRIDFGDGIVTNAAFDCNEQLKTLHFDDVDFTDKQVLDIGCNAGFFTCEAIKRGAYLGVGIDRNKEQITKANYVSTYLGTSSHTSFIVYDIDQKEMSLTYRNDITLMLSVFHHVKHPKWVLQNLGRVTKETAILEVRTKPEGDPREMKSIPDTVKPRSVFPSVNTMTNALTDIAGFKRVTVFGGNKTDERKVFHCYKEVT